MGPNVRDGLANKAMMVRVGAIGLAAVLLLFVIAPIIWTAVSAGVGLLVLGGIAAVGYGVLQAIPLIAQKIENRVLGLRKKEARENPIEQLQNFLLARAKQVASFKDAVGQIGAQIKSLEDMIDDRKKKKPGYDASKQEKSVSAMKEAHKALKQKYQSAEKALAELKDVIEDKEFEWKFAQSGQKALNNLNATNGQDLLNLMLADEAYDSVRDNFNKVFADLEMEASRLNDRDQLTFGGEAIDVSAIRIPQLEGVRR